MDSNAKGPVGWAGVLAAPVSDEADEGDSADSSPGIAMHAVLTEEQGQHQGQSRQPQQPYHGLIAAWCVFMHGLIKGGAIHVLPWGCTVRASMPSSCGTSSW